MKTEKEALLCRNYKAFAYSAGPCRLQIDEDISIDFEKEIPERPPLESVGIDVFHTVRNNGFRAEIVTSPEVTPNYFSLVLIE